MAIGASTHICLRYATANIRHAGTLRNGRRDVKLQFFLHLNSMANWDAIYRDYKKGGEAWASLSDTIMPEFKKFLQESDFECKHVLDIGCGTGYYLAFLYENGFDVDGVDSSPTAVEMTEAVLGKDVGRVKTADMFEMHIDKNTYDLIISIAAIQHGLKNDIQNLIKKIHPALVDGGKAFITFPDFESSKKWNTFKNSKDLGGGTFVPMSGPEEGLPHSFYTKAEIQKLFSEFSDVRLRLDDRGRWIVQASK